MTWSMALGAVGYCVIAYSVHLILDYLSVKRSDRHLDSTNDQLAILAAWFWPVSTALLIFVGAAIIVIKPMDMIHESIKRRIEILVAKRREEKKP